jgi:hypothetical protein
MTPEELVEQLTHYETQLVGIAERFIRKPGEYHIQRADDGPFREMVGTLYDLLRDTLGKERYAREVNAAYAEGLNNWGRSPSLHSVEEIARLVRTVIARIKRNPQIVGQPSAAAGILRFSVTQRRCLSFMAMTRLNDESCKLCFRTALV